MINKSKLLSEAADTLYLLIEKGRAWGENEPSEENPIEFENDYGKFKYVGGGKLLCHPKKSVDYIVLNFSIKKTGENGIS